MANIKVSGSEMYRLALDNLYDGILICDADCKVVYINKQYSAITGLSEEEILNKKLQVLEKEGVVNQAISPKVIETARAQSAIHRYVTGKQAFTNAVPLYYEGDLLGVVNATRDLDVLLEMRDLAEETRTGQLEMEISSLRKLLNQDHDFIAESPSMKETVAKANMAAPYDTTVLITGTSGTGKEVIARYIHSNSPRADESFIRVNCASIPKNLFESELFGYEEGAFTGASEAGKLGMFELADKGTILLDEIGEMPYELQSKLLRVIQEQEIYRVGGEKPIPIDVRILASTNKDLEEEVAKGTFRDDLYYRINVFPIHIDNLKDRREDVEPLINATLTKLNHKYNTTVTIEKDALDVLEAYDFPGNVRELENIIEYMYVLSTDSIKLETIPGKILTQVMLAKDDDCPGKRIFNEKATSLSGLMDLCEKSILEDTIVHYSTLEEAASVLGIHASTLSRKMKKYNLSF